MNALELQKFLHSHIPISQTMGIEVLQAGSEGVRLTAPLAPNINHGETVFGGSASAVAILSAWALIYLRMRDEGIECRVVIQKNTMRYEQPIMAQFTAQSAVQNIETWPRFLETFARRHRARIRVISALFCNGERVGALEADFVAIGVQPI
jgi:thioesterase domain-containing protein